MIHYSFILPWHKDDALFRRAVASVPVRDDVELLTVEDKERKGAGHARNEALAKARGKWLIFIDSDDYFVADVLELLDRHRDGEADIVYFNQRAEMVCTGAPSSRVDDKTRLLAAYSGHQEQLDFYCRYCYPEPVGKMVRRELVERWNIRFDETSCANDYMFSVLCGLRAESVAFDPAVLYVLTEREGSVSHDYFESPVKVEDRLWVYLRVQKLFAANGIRLYPFSGMWMMCRKAGPGARAIAEEFRRRESLSRVYILWGCACRIIRKRLRIGVPFNA